MCICMLWSCDYHMQVGDYVYVLWSCDSHMQVGNDDLHNLGHLQTNSCQIW